MSLAMDEKNFVQVIVNGQVESAQVESAQVKTSRKRVTLLGSRIVERVEK